jgi:hypothetical protein
MDWLGLVRPVMPSISRYLYAWIVSPAHGRRILEKAAYDAGKPGLNLDNLRELQVALPPLEEQFRLVEAIASQISTIEDADIALQHGIRRADRLRQSILKLAFEGNRHERKETERFKSFAYEDLLKRDKVSLDIFWLKDDSLRCTRRTR